LAKTNLRLKNIERRLLSKRPENPFALIHEKEKTGFAQETVVLDPG
jgi:hypothetical protein